MLPSVNEQRSQVEATRPLYPHPQPSLRGCRLMQEAPGLLPSLKLPVKASPRQAARSDGGRQCVCTSCQHLAQQLESEGLCWSSAEGQLERVPQKQDLPSSWNAYSCRGHRSKKGKKSDHVCIAPIDPVKAGGGERRIWPPEGQKHSLQSSAGLSSGDLTQGLQVRPCGPGMQWGLSRGEQW